MEDHGLCWWAHRANCECNRQTVVRDCSAQAAAKQECPREGVGIPEEIQGGGEEKEL